MNMPTRWPLRNGPFAGERRVLGRAALQVVTSTTGGRVTTSVAGAAADQAENAPTAISAVEQASRSRTLNSTPSRAAVAEGVAVVGWVGPVAGRVVAGVARVAEQVGVRALGVVVVLVPDVAEHGRSPIAAEEACVPHVRTGRVVDRHHLSAGLSFVDQVRE